MAKTLNGIAVSNRSIAPAQSLQAVRTLRLVLGLTALLGAIIFLEGTSWDIQWHSYIGRDRTLIPPHIMMLTGVALSGIAGLLTVLIESLWARRSKIIAENSTNLVDFFYAPLGAYIVGFAALMAAVAFPLDAYWHALYGIDVEIWAPFHIMFLSSMGIVALGAVYMLVSAAHLTPNSDSADTTTKRIAYAGSILALATVLSLFTLLLFDALSEQNQINLGFASINVFPLLSGTLVAFTLVAAAYALPWRWIATSIVVCYFFLAGIMALFVQPATDWLLTLERLTYRRTHPPTSVVALEWFLTPILVAILIDVIMHQARRKHWSSRTLTLILALTALLSGAAPIMVAIPILPVELVMGWGVVGYLISSLMGLAGAYLGTSLGRNVGESLHALERS